MKRPRRTAKLALIFSQMRTIARPPPAGTTPMQGSAEDLLTQIEDLHLMPAKDIEAVKARWFKPGRKEGQDVARFSDWLRVNGYLT